MSNQECFLISVLYVYEHEDKTYRQLLRCALKLSMDDIPADLAKHPMEPENLGRLHEMLPKHVRSCGPIVDVQPLFEIHEVTK